jgi:hypothetical protein
MTGREYPPEGRFWDLSPADRERRLEIAQDLVDHLRWLRGDPSLTAWEEGFLTGLEGMLRQSRGRYGPSRKQWDVVWKIGAKLDGTAAQADAETGYEEVEG